MNKPKSLILSFIITSSIIQSLIIIASSIDVSSATIGDKNACENGFRQGAKDWQTRQAFDGSVFNEHSAKYTDCYRNGFVTTCMKTGIDRETCEEHEDNQFNVPQGN
jgi:hypothetical protein